MPPISALMLNINLVQQLSGLEQHVTDCSKPGIHGVSNLEETLVSFQKMGM